MKKILFLTGTRADFGKLKSLIKAVQYSEKFIPYIFVTGMHMMRKYGHTAIEVEKTGFKNIYKYINQNSHDSMDQVLAKTIAGLSDYVKEIKPDLIVVHGDRVEALAGAIVGSLNNILVAHIEGGEVSGTIDELIRHSVTKLSHIHFASNSEAKKRLLQLGEVESSIYVIGSPDLDVMSSNELPSLLEAKDRYDIDFEGYYVFIYHPVTTELDSLESNIKECVNAMKNSGRNFIVIYPNNDHGSEVILNHYEKINSKNIKIFPSIRFEYFLTLIKNSKGLIGNSSAGVREAPFYGLGSINIGSRQNSRSKACSIINVDGCESEIINAISQLESNSYEETQEFGDGKSCELFMEAINSEGLWRVSRQKVFKDFLNVHDI